MTLKTLLDNLKYIAESPPRLYGGFHPQIVALSKAAIYQLKKRIRKP